MRLFLTGGTGFLGHHVAEQLLQRGHQVLALARHPERAHRLKALGAEVFLGSLPQKDSLQNALAGAEAIIHVAGAVKALTLQDFLFTNREGTAYLVSEVLKMAQLPKRFIYISTIAVHNPQKSKDFCLPASQCEPLSYYGESKRQAEITLDPLKNKVPVAILRPPVLYGPYDHELLPFFRLIQKNWVPLLEQGGRELSLCYGPDVARAVVDLIQMEKFPEATFCLDDGEIHTWQSLSAAIAEVLGKNPRYLKIPKIFFTLAAAGSQTWANLSRKPQVLTLNKLKEMFLDRWVCGFEKLNHAIGWKPKVLLKEGVRKTAEFYYKNKLL